ncbi:hypothetical protein [Terrisporobacter sp.]|uniref:hypothetical protein n=1 Tax=Terrisporobacter sp. TaxID=1965305 RepID=UPI0026209C43|nr:hypothetical protein [Terrisporobacter sp.]
MGVILHKCSKCGKIFSDCGYFIYCNEESYGCSEIWCSKECAEADGYIKGHCKISENKFNKKCNKHSKGEKWCDEDCINYVKESCNYCRHEDFHHDIIIKYILKEYVDGRTIDDIKEEMTLEIDKLLDKVKNKRKSEQ